MEHRAVFAEISLFSSAEFDLIYLIHTTDVSRGLVATGNSLPMIYWKLGFHAVMWWEKQL